jgi:hypothetical protein
VCRRLNITFIEKKKTEVQCGGIKKELSPEPFSFFSFTFFLMVLGFSTQDFALAKSVMPLALFSVFFR